ncbi:hypothetical protein GCM10027059_26200 [Myceligenerans halotolerans]
MKTRLDTAQTGHVVAMVVIAMGLGLGIGHAWGSSVPDGAYIVTPAVPSVEPSPVVDRLERGAACRCADRSVDQ